MSSSERSSPTFPLHRFVWDNNFQGLEEALREPDCDKEELDPRGRTPLMLAVTLGHLESIRCLLRHGTNVNVINKGGWTVVQEAVATGDPELLQLVLERRDHQRYSSRVGGIPELLQKLKSAPDFYVEMKWEFTSWIPFVSRMCPSDTYKVYKQGSNVRIDTTLLGFDQSSWVRGSRTYIFSGKESGADLYEIDHDARMVYCEEMRILSPEELDSYVQSEEQISARLTTPLVLTYLDTEKINFERTRSGFWGWGGSDKTETVSGHESKVFAASNVELITKTRTEHLTEEDKKRAKSNKNPMQSILGMAEEEVKLVSSVAAAAAAAQHSGSSSSDNLAAAGASSSEHFSANNPCCITQEEYFGGVDLQDRDIGRPKEQSSKVQKFHAQLWLCEDYPLSLQEQVMPIVDLMAISNTHFQKLKDFITCSFPAGFPVKIEIPLFHVINARITFGNIFAMTQPVEGITVIKEADDNRTSCVVNDETFAIPEGYSRIGGQSSNQVRRQYEDDDDQLLQYTIRQSLVDGGGGGGGAGNALDAVGREEVDIWEALQGQAPQVPESTMATSSVGMYTDKYLELQIQRAIELSLANGNSDSSSPTPAAANPNPQVLAAGNQLVNDDDLSLALRLSQHEEEEHKRRQMEEDEMLERVLTLSLTEK